MKLTYCLTAFLIIFLYQNSFSQLYQGPAQGSVASGVMVSTDNFGDSFEGDPLPDYLIPVDNTNTYVPQELPDSFNKIKPTAPEGSNFVFDKSTINGESDSPSLILKNFPGVPRTNFIPPDASIAAGPTHLLGAVNSSFRIWDKQGNVIKSIAGATFYASLGLGIGGNLSDPKISYDHYAKRWIIAWITPPIGPLAYDVISVSDDSIPLGTWYNYAMRSDLNGSTSSGVWRDYEGIGYDANAIYITGNGFTISSSNFVYSKIRIINKAQLYANTGGAVTWFDLWDIRDPENSSVNFGIRPSIIYGNSNEYYFLCNANSSGSYISLYKLTNPLTNPSMTGVSIPVVQYFNPAPSRQLGSNTTITAGGTSGFRCEPVFKNGFLHAVHAVRYNSQYSAFKYYKINVGSNFADKDITFGADEFYYSYPAISVDKDQNVLVSYSRSGLSQYIGAYFTTRIDSDPSTFFNPSSVLQPGKNTYINTGQSDRWGDYMGTWLDPSNEQDFWIMTEYAELQNFWGVWVGQIRVSPYPTARVFLNKDTLGFGNIEVNRSSDTQSVKIVNYGNTTLTISGIQHFNSNFNILNTPVLPVNLNFNDSLVLRIVFQPTSAGFKNDSLQVTSNDASNPVKYASIKGKGFVITPVQPNTVYGVTGTQSNGILMTIDPVTGTGTSIGPSGFSQLNGLSIRPSNNQLYAVISSSPTTQLVRVNAAQGDAYILAPLPIANIRSIAFDINDELYCSTTDGKIYRYNFTTNDTFFIGNTGITSLFGMKINPVNRSLWGMSAIGSLYKINKSNASVQLIGSTGLSPNTDISFSKTGKLYGISGIGATVNKLISIDTVSGVGTLIGTNAGFSGINGVAISPEIVGVQNISNIIPEKFELQQNYPNPFNPVTNLKFGITNPEFVTLKVYNTLGMEVEVLVNENLTPGKYEVRFDGSNFASGIYFYRIKAGEFVDTKRMMLIK
ncbi:MAG: T9SS type A sorting domain-containing protein [bacterium]|nr:T9SS type A sorting domain-containing protein [bacterium]